MSRNTTLLAVILIAIGTQTQASSLPSVTGTLIYNLDAAVNVTTSGSSVSAWQDAAGGAITFGQATAGHQPTSFTSGFGVNNLPYVSFDGLKTAGNSDYLTTTANTNPKTVFIVGKTTVANFLGGLFGTDQSDTGLRLDASGTTGDFDNTGGYPVTSLAWTNSSGVTTNGSGANLTISPGVGPLYILSGTDSNSGVFNNGTTIGNYFYFASPDGRPWGGQIAEVVVYSNVLSPGDRTTITNFLYNKYFVPTPEPGCFTLLSFGIIGLFAVARRRRA